MEIVNAGKTLLTAGYAILGLFSLIMASGIAWLYRNVLHDAGALLTLTILSLAVPVTAHLALTQTRLYIAAQDDPTVASVELQRPTPSQGVIYVTLTDPGFAYAEYNGHTYSANGSIDKRTGHTFEISPINTKPALLKIFINGKLKHTQMIK